MHVLACACVCVYLCVSTITSLSYSIFAFLSSYSLSYLFFNLCNIYYIPIFASLLPHIPHPHTPTHTSIHAQKTLYQPHQPHQSHQPQLAVFPSLHIAVLLLFCIVSVCVFVFACVCVCVCDRVSHHIFLFTGPFVVFIVLASYLSFPVPYLFSLSLYVCV